MRRSQAEPSIVETGRLQVRPLEPRHEPFLLTMLGDPEVMRYHARCYSAADVAAWVQRQQYMYALNGHGMWLLQERTTGRPLGQIGLVPRRLVDCDELELGLILHRPYWRQGFALESAQAVIQYAFRNLRRRRVITLVRHDNLAAAAVVERLGMVQSHVIQQDGEPYTLFAIRNSTTTTR